MPASVNPKLRDLVSLTRWVKGKMRESFCTQSGRFSIGKKVSLKRNMGVISRNMGMLNSSMFGMMLVIYMPSDPKATPPKKDKGRMSIPCG